MAHVMRWRYGETNPITVTVGADAVVEIGDLVWLDSNSTVTPASNASWGIDLATTQTFFHDHFLGVAMQASTAGETDDIRIATSGVFEFDANPATYQPGDFVGPAKAQGDELLNQTVAATSAAHESIGRVAQRVASGAKVLVRIVSTNQFGGPQPVSVP